MDSTVARSRSRSSAETLGFLRNDVACNRGMPRNPAAKFRPRQLRTSVRGGLNLLPGNHAPLAHQLIENRVEFLGIKGLQQVMPIAGGLAASAMTTEAKAAHRHTADGVGQFGAFQEFPAIPIRQAN